MVRYSWILTRRMKLFLLCFFPGMIQSWRLLPHLFQAAIALVTARVLNFLFPGESKKMWLKSWSELVRTLSLDWLRQKKDGTTPVGWWLWLESQRLLFSWHGRFCQTNFFVSNIDVWKWRNWWWLSRKCLRYCHFCTFLNTLETGFVQTYSLVSFLCVVNN